MTESRDQTSDQTLPKIAPDLRNYFYLTFCLILGIGISLTLFYASLKFEGDRLEAQLSREGEQFGYTIDLMISNQSIRIQSLEETIQMLAASPVKNENLLKTILRSSVFRSSSYMEVVGKDSAGNPIIKRHWRYEPDANPKFTIPGQPPNATAVAIVAHMLKTNRKQMSYFNSRQEIGTSFVHLMRSTQNKNFFYSFTASPEVLFESAANLSQGSRLLIEQKPDKSFWLLERIKDQIVTKRLTPAERDQILNSTDSKTVYQAQNSEMFSFILLNNSVIGYQMRWSVIVLVAGLLITALLASLIFSLISRNIEVQNMVNEKTLHLATESERAHRASYAKTRFLANVSHEVRTPLNMIMGMADLLKETHLSNKQNNYVDNFRNAGNHLLLLINDILEMAKIDTEEVEYLPENTSLIEFFESLCQLANAQAQWKGLELRFALDPEIPKVVSIEAARLRQVVINLLNNAVKFTDDGFVELRARLLQTNPGSKQLEISVRDSGVGIPQSKLDEIFRPFFQVNPSLTRKKSGVGLGLSLVERIVSRLGGTIRASSRLNQGSIFTVTLPLTIVDATPWINEFQNSKSESKVLVLSEDEDLKLNLGQFMTAAHITFDSLEAKGLFEKDIRSTLKVYSHIILDQNLLEKIEEPILSDVLKAQKNVTLLATSKDYQAKEKNDTYRIRFTSILERPVMPRALFSILDPADKKQLPAPPPKDNRTQPKADRPLSILVVDDDFGNRVLLKAYLEKMNYKVRMASEGQEALDLCETEKPDILVADLQMPHMDGFALIEKLRAQQCDEVQKSKVMILTADALEETAQHARSIKVDAYLTKPIRKADFLSVIDDLATT